MGKIQGVVTGQVVNITDPDQQGRIQVSLPYLGGQNQSYWAPVATHDGRWRKWIVVYAAVGR